MAIETDTTELLLSEVSGLDPKHASQADGVYRRLREAILDGEIPPGTTLERADLVSGYRVGDEVICAALKGLARDGLTRDQGPSVSVTAPSDRRSGGGAPSGKPSRGSGVCGARYYSAFSESKTLSQWVEDRRCKVDLGRLYARIHTGGWGVERAITTPLNRSRDL
ncbi:GntR family transcriptional regulator [Streptomyces hokutonensis]|uniref:GntR family transcriptional regulator n=1 Tax=Streptomyces hokutonensis TaxID=1306990 RepID=A0ABW6LT97_9ACTN